MPANTAPIFPVSPVIGVANISSAITTRTVTGVTGLTSVQAGGTNGTRVDRISIKATATTTAGIIRLWLYSGSGNAQLFHEEIVSAITPSATTAAYSTDIYYTDLLIPSGWTLYASTEKAEAFNVFLHGGEY
jgi:hypothetical protein